MLPTFGILMIAVLGVAALRWVLTKRVELGLADRLCDWLDQYSVWIGYTIIE